MSETYPWEQYPLHELEAKGIATLGRGNIISKIDIQSNPGGYPIYSSSAKGEGLFGTYGDYMFDEEMITWSVDGGGNLFYRPRHRFSVTNVSGYMRLDTSVLDYRFAHAALALQHSKLTFDYQTKAHPSVIRNLYYLPIPPLPEQKKIAEILSGVERTISQTSQRIEKHKTILLATLEEIFDYLGGKADLRPLGDCCRHILDFRGRTPAKLGMEWGSGTIRALSANNVRDGFIDFNRECYLGSESLYRNWMTKGDCERGDIVFTMEAPMGNVAIIPDDEKYILSQRVVLLSPDRQQILPEYLYWFMRSSRFRSDCENLATGTTAKGIKQANLITIGVPIATLEEQAKAVQLPTSMERLITSEEQRLLQLNLIKQSLSADLLSGRKRVSV